jgi:hypothetical protein
MMMMMIMDDDAAADDDDDITSKFQTGIRFVISHLQTKFRTQLGL